MGEIISILGIPVDNMTMQETLDKIIDLVDQYQLDHRARQVATVNVDFIVNTLGWLPSHIRHPELLQVLRHADLVTADGMPIVWLSRLLKTPLKNRITGADLVPALAERCANQELSIYFLGGRKDSAQTAANKLIKQYPSLKIAGTAAPFIHTVGHEISDYEQEDKPIIDIINQAAPDILLVGFGNPKQEIWFNRNHHKLNVPVTIGIVGTFDFIIGAVKRAPGWMQHSGLKWIWRISKDPNRLIKRYLLGLMKFSCMVLPPIIVLNILDKLTRSDQPPAIKHGAIRLHHRFDRNNIGRVKEMLNTVDTLDISRCRYIDSAAAGLLLDLSRSGRLKTINSKPQKILKILDCADLPERDQLTHNILTVDQKHLEGYLDVTLSGVLTADQISNLNQLYTALDNQDCILHIADLTFIDSSGLGVLLKLSRHQKSNNRLLILTKPSPSVEQMFNITHVFKHFTIAKNVEQAHRLLNNV